MTTPLLLRITANIVAIASCGLTSAVVQAQVLVERDAPTVDARVVVYDYAPDKIMKVFVRPQSATRIEMTPGERIVYVHNDKKPWFSVTMPNDRSSLIVQPNFENVQGGLYVRTTLPSGQSRTYDFELQSTGEGRKYWRVVRFSKPESTEPVDDTNTPAATASARGPDSQAIAAAAAAATAGKPDSSTPAAGLGQCGAEMRMTPDALNTNFVIEGNASFRPVSVFTDQRRTFFRMPSPLPVMPVLFEVDAAGELSLVNYSVCPPHLIAQSAGTKFQLVLGKQTVTITPGAARSNGFSWFGQTRMVGETP